MAKDTLEVGMIGSTARAALWIALGALTLGAAVATRQALAQEPAAEEITELSADALAELVGPIALYPDDLVGIVLPASTFPLQVVQAARFLDERAKNSNLKPNEDWDDSIVALLNYPEVVKLMNDDLDWTWRLGDAVIDQRAAVLDAIQGFRDRAYAAGNLRSDDRQVVENDDEGAIAIKPADPEVIYVPYYEPERVVVYQRVPVYHYYPVAYPVYYYPYPVDYSFHTGFFWGVSSVFSIGWHTHFLHVHHHDYWGHPYYGRHYHDPFYFRRGANISVSRGSYVWEPHYRRGAQPFTRSDGRRYVGTRDERGGAAQGGSYRSGNGAVSRSAGGQRHQPLDPNAAASRNRATPGTSPRAQGNDERSGGSYRSGSGQTNQPIRNRAATPQAGEQRQQQIDAAAAANRNRATPGTTPRAQGDGGTYRSGSGQTHQPVRNRAATPQTGEQYRPAPRQNEAPRQYEAPQQNAAPRERGAAPRADAPPARSPGEYRSGRGAQQSFVPQRSSEGAAAASRATPPPAAAPRTFGRVEGGSTYRQSTAQPRAERAAPSYRGGGGESRANTGRNPNQSVRGGRATER
jgi:hypothetical protein